MIIKEKIRLHLGCGDRQIPGFINIDIRNTDAVDVVSDISKNLPYENGSVDLIYSCANIEHFGRKEWKNVISYWYDLLKPGGILRLSTADFESVCREYLENGEIQKLFGFVVGGQKNDYDWHGMIFDFKFLKNELQDVGFRKVEKYDWRETSHSDVDDYSSAYLPHLEKQKGRLMMLNIEAEK